MSEEKPIFVANMRNWLEKEDMDCGDPPARTFAAFRVFVEMAEYGQNLGLQPEMSAAIVVYDGSKSVTLDEWAHPFHSDKTGGEFAKALAAARHRADRLLEVVMAYQQAVHRAAKLCEEKMAETPPPASEH